MPSSLLIIISLYLSLSSIALAQISPDKFLQCLESHDSNSVSQVLYTPENPSYNSTFLSSIQNLRFVSPSMPKPSYIVTPTNEPQIQSVILCSKASRLQIRVRCGGHDYEGLSYASKLPFVIIDMKNLRSIEVDAKSRTAWIEGGVLLGNLSYQIATKSPNLAFPAGLCPTVGVGGHISGGGYGTLLRKYGLAADMVLDARIVTANGEIHDRKSMGEDLFWAIRGGGAASFGVITAWKVKLAVVPKTVIVFTITRKLEQNATDLVHRWQHIAHKFDRNLFIRIIITRVHNEGQTTVQAAFNSLYLGKTEELLPLMQESFPELGLVKEDCMEKKWIEAILYFSDLPPGSTLNDLTKRDPYPRMYYKAKSDFVTNPIPKHALRRVWDFFKEDESETARLIFAPFGGRMSDIPGSHIPYPHRAGNLYEIQHIVFWDEIGNNKEPERYLNWIRRVYDYVTPYVSKNPRAAYMNYRDLDLGVNNIFGNTSYEEARGTWGKRSFKNNFRRLVEVKTKVDPSNFFSSEQSIPTF